MFCDDGGSRIAYCAIPLLAIWPIVSMILGVTWGALSSTFVTLIISFIALVRLPFIIWRTLSVAATAREPFKGIQGNLWRLPILLLVPIGPMLFICACIIGQATVGTLFLIGTATTVIYNHEYAKASKVARSNLLFEEDTLMERYLSQLKEWEGGDEPAILTIEFIKGIFTTIAAFPFACLAFIPFSIVTATITAIRLPINLFKTTKIALCTVMLRWDLRILMLLSLPLIHTLFPVLVLVASLVGSFFWTWGQTQGNLYEDKSPFHEWNQLIIAVKEYYKEHIKFVSERCDPFDHISGIPYGWNGQQYGLEIERIIRLQLKFFLFVALALYQTPIILASTTVVLAIKYVPTCLNVWTIYASGCLNNLSSVLCAWPFHLLAIALIPVGIVIFYLGIVLFAVIYGFYEVVEMIFVDHASLCKCVAVPWKVIWRCDKWTEELSFRLFCKEPCHADNGAEPRHQGDANLSNVPAKIIDASVYWDRFASQCIQSTEELLANGFLDYDAILGMEPSCMQSIPSVAVFEILIDSLEKEGLKAGDIFWKVDETVCKAKGRAPLLDNIASLLWPMVLDLQNFTKKHKKEILALHQEQTLIITMQAMLCDNHDTDDSTEAIKTILEMTDKRQVDLNKKLRTKISRLVLAMLRVRPFQDRMEKIFKYKYQNGINKTKDDIDAQIDNKPDDEGSKGEATKTSNDTETVLEMIKEFISRSGIAGE